MKRISLLILVIVLLLTGCAKHVSTTKVEADGISIYYSFSSYALFSDDQKIIDDLMYRFDSLGFKKTNEKLDIGSALHVSFAYCGDPVKSFAVDENGVFWLDGETQSYRVSSGSFDYDHLKKVYEDSKNIPEETRLPVISITRMSDMYHWETIEPGMITTDIFIERTGITLTNESIFDLTTPQLWGNQKMQLFAGILPGEDNVLIYYLYFTEDGVIRPFEDQNGISGSGIYGYAIKQVYSADLDNDRIYEIYTNSVIGSGISSSFVQAYDPASKTFSDISLRAETEYSFCVYNGNLFLIAKPFAQGSEDQTVVYKPVLKDGKITYEDDLEISLQDKILKNELLVMIDSMTKPTKENPYLGVSSDPYDYIDAHRDIYYCLVAGGQSTVSIFVDILRNSAVFGLDKYLMAAVCAEITGIGNGNDKIWSSAKEWLQLYEDANITP